MSYFSNSFIRRVALVALSIFIVALSAGCSNNQDEVVILTANDVWSRQPAEGQSASAIYAVIDNPTDKDIRITDATTTVSDRVELHETIMNDGVMSMEHRPDGFVVPANGQFLFEPGGPHVMVFDIDPSNYPATFEVTFHFEGGTFTATGETRAIAGQDPHAHHDHDHGDHGDHDHGDHGDHDHGDHDHGKGD